MNLAIFCADVGSTARNRFAWAGQLATGELSGNTDIEDLCRHVVLSLNGGRVALGFECPLFIPLEQTPRLLARARTGEGNRPWSAGAGCGALATGLAQATFVLTRIRADVPADTPIFLRWSDFNAASSGLLPWEAFVSGAGKTGTDLEDARAAVRAFQGAMPDPDSANRVKEHRALSLIGAAVLRAGWAVPTTILEQPCLMIGPALESFESGDLRSNARVLG